MKNYRPDQENERQIGFDLGQGVALVETKKALLVKLLEKEDGSDEVWIPLACIHEDSEVFAKESGQGKVIVQRWWALKNAEILGIDDE